MCTYLYMHICVYIMYISICTYIWKCIYMHTCKSLIMNRHEWMYVHMSVYRYKYVYIFVHMSVCICIPVCICVHVCLCVCTYVFMYIYVYVYIRLYVTSQDGRMSRVLACQSGRSGNAKIMGLSLEHAALKPGRVKLITLKCDTCCFLAWHSGLLG